MLAQNSLDGDYPVLPLAKMFKEQMPRVSIQVIRQGSSIAAV